MTHGSHTSVKRLEEANGGKFDQRSVLIRQSQSLDEVALVIDSNWLASRDVASYPLLSATIFAHTHIEHCRFHHEDRAEIK